MFEVNPDRREGTHPARSAARPFFTVLTQDVAVDLGVPDDKVAQQLMDQATPEYLIPRGVNRVAS